MKHEKLIKLLSDDLATDGHTLGSDIRDLPDPDLNALSNVLDHWRHQVGRELTRRSPAGRDGA